MRLSLFDDYRLGLTEGDLIWDISSVIEERWRSTPQAMNHLIENWDRAQPTIAEIQASSEPRPVAEVRLLPPLPRPRQLFAAPLNYRPHVAEMIGSEHAPTGLRASHSARNLGFFLKAAGSISGPEDAVELPALPDRSFHHEVELGVVIGKQARGLSPEQVRDHVFGYVCLLDITLRTDGERQEERTMRKSYETFTPLGASIVTADEIADPHSLDLGLWVNGELRQEANTADLICNVDELVATASHVVTLYPGDLYATGTPEGVGPIVPGDRIKAVVQQVGELDVAVTRRTW